MELLRFLYVHNQNNQKYSLKRNEKAGNVPINTIDSMKPLKIERNIKDGGDYSEYASDVLEEFLSDLVKRDGMVRYVTDSEREELDLEDYVQFLYTRKGERIAKEMIRRLTAVGEAHFPDDFITISSSLYFSE